MSRGVDDCRSRREIYIAGRAPNSCRIGTHSSAVTGRREIRFALAGRHAYIIIIIIILVGRRERDKSQSARTPTRRIRAGRVIKYICWRTNVKKKKKRSCQQYTGRVLQRDSNSQENDRWPRIREEQNREKKTDMHVEKRNCPHGFFPPSFCSTQYTGTRVYDSFPIMICLRNK